jgi:iron complex transport system substrate-binding protein
MNETGPGRIIWVISVLLCVAPGGCKRAAAPVASPAAKSPTVASLVPSATDLIVGMGAANHLVAVSNYDRDTATADLPRVGDYETIDWEKLSQLHPNVIVTYYGIGHTPPGFIERARELNIRQLNLVPKRLSDIYEVIASLGDACGEPDAAQIEAAKLRDGLERVRSQVQGEPRVRAIIVTDPSGLDLAGRDTFLDDLLIDAGGENALTPTGYVTVDREALSALDPEAIIQLLPAADEATRSRAAAFWEANGRLRAVKEHRVYSFTEGYMMLPGSHVADVAAKFAAALHSQKDPASRPSTTNPDH